MHKVGTGTVYAGESLTEAFDTLHLGPDFDYVKDNSESDVEFAHRKLKNADIYFLDNRSNHDELIDATFRVAGMQPELWHAETGRTEPASFKIAGSGTTVPLHLEAWGTVFVVFRKPTREPSHVAPDPIQRKVATFTGPWSVNFQPGRGAPASITLDELADWSQNSDFKTTVGVYSLRAKERPTVSTPVTWDEVERCLKKKDPSTLVFESSQTLQRVDRLGDLFEPVLKLKQKLPRLGSLTAHPGKKIGATKSRAVARKPA